MNRKIKDVAHIKLFPLPESAANCTLWYNMISSSLHATLGHSPEVTHWVLAMADVNADDKQKTDYAIKFNELLRRVDHFLGSRFAQLLYENKSRTAIIIAADAAIWTQTPSDISGCAIIRAVIRHHSFSQGAEQHNAVVKLGCLRVVDYASYEKLRQAIDNLLRLADIDLEPAENVNPLGPSNNSVAYSLRNIILQDKELSNK